MRSRISKWLIKLADKINPQERLSSIERIDNYEAKKLGICFAHTKNQINNYRQSMKYYEGLSNSKADEMLIKEIKNEIRQSIILTIDKDGLIEYSVKEVGDELHVSGEIKVYIKKNRHESSNK